MMEFLSSIFETMHVLSWINLLGAFAILAYVFVLRKRRASPVSILGVMGVYFILLVFGSVYARYFFGLNWPSTEYFGSELSAEFGQVGDFIGGVLNPLMSFLALMALMLSLEYQQSALKAQREALDAQLEELRLVRDETRANLENGKAQTIVFKKQAFEGTFQFFMSSHARIVSDLASTKYRIEGRAVLISAYNSIVSAIYSARATIPLTQVGSSGYEENMQIIRNPQRLIVEREYLHGYFISLIGFFSFLDSQRMGGFFEINYDKFQVDGVPFDFVRDYVDKRRYAGIFMTHISPYEAALIMLNAIDEGQEELRYYIEKYSLLQWMNSELFALIDSDISDVIDKSAFCSDEDMDIKDLYRKELKRLYEF